MRRKPRDPTLFIVDDDDVAVMTFERLIKRSLNLDYPIAVARDGAEALTLLNETGANRLARPIVILLDLNMPRMGGLEFLDRIREDDTPRDTVVFVFSTSETPEDIAAAYAKGAAGYVVKPGTSAPLRDALEMIATYCRTVALPR